MKIVVCCLKYEYGFPERGLSFEYYNFLDTLKKMDGGAHTVIHFPFDEIYKKFGREVMNLKLIELVQKERPDLVFFFLFSDEFKKDVLLYLKNDLKVTTFNWFADDHWRFFNFSRFYAPLFSYVSTTDLESFKRYKKYGIDNVIKTQWGFNHYIYKLPDNYDFKTCCGFDVTFVGQNHSNRARYVCFLKKNGINVQCWGSGWENGRLSFENMIEIFRNSKINLNFSASSAKFDHLTFAKIFLRRRIDMKLRFYPLGQIPSNIKSIYHRIKSKQIKGRIFEIPGSGGFLLTENADNLSDYFVDGKEIVIFEDKYDLLQKVKFYLKNEELRQEIAYNGYLRAIREHTYEARFKEIFRKIGLTQ